MALEQVPVSQDDPEQFALDAGHGVLLYITLCLSKPCCGTHVRFVV